MRIIALRPSGETKVDDDDFEWLQHFTWRKSPQGYVYRNIGFVNGDRGKSTSLYLHRFIMEPCDPFHIDHVNGDRLDNRKSNLRLVLPAENMWNMDSRRSTPKKYSQYFGVGFNENAWTASMTTPQNKRLLLGRYGTELEAAVAYDIASMEHWGELARLNFPGGLPDIIPKRRTQRRTTTRITISCSDNTKAIVSIAHPDADIRDALASRLRLLL